MSEVKGVLLCGGLGTRLQPLTHGTSKHILNVYDKPMFYYSLSQLLLAEIIDIAIVSQKEHLFSYKKYFGDGSSLGVNLQYIEQAVPDGIPDAISRVGDLFKGCPLFVVLGDNFLYGPNLSDKLKYNSASNKAQIYSYLVNDPSQYGVIEYDKKGECVNITEKPKNPKSNWVSIGSYFFPSDVIKMISKLEKSVKNEYQVVDLINKYLIEDRVSTVKLGRGYVWFDLGTHEKLFEASNFIRSVQLGQGYNISSPIEIATVKKFV